MKLSPFQAAILAVLPNKKSGRFRRAQFSRAEVAPRSGTVFGGG
jgi:hypothetical protein